MQKNRLKHFVRVGLVGLMIAVAIILGLRLVGAGRDVKDSGEEALATPVRTKSIKGQTRVIIARQDLAASGIGMESLETLTYQEQATALGTVVSPQALAEQKHTYQAAAADATRGELVVKAARLEVQRLLPLHRDDRIVSDKAFEAAQNNSATEEANLKVALAQLHVQQAALVQQWGPVLGAWLTNGAAQFDRLLAGQDFLIQLALPASGHTTEPTKAQVEPTPGIHLNAKIISGVPQADPKFQGQNFYAVMPADPRLRPGMMVPATVSIGSPVTGVVVPDVAIVRWQGKPWVFVGVAEGEFARQPVVTNIATPRGWLVTSGLTAGTPVAIRGAQLLLSEEIKAQPTGGERK